MDFCGPGYAAQKKKKKAQTEFTLNSSPGTKRMQDLVVSLLSPQGSVSTPRSTDSLESGRAAAEQRASCQHAGEFAEALYKRLQEAKVLELPDDYIAELKREYISCVNKQLDIIRK